VVPQRGVVPSEAGSGGGASSVVGRWGVLSCYLLVDAWGGA
jgi:hypothetical protein